LLYISIVVLAALNVAPIKTPKLSSGKWYYAITAYTLVITLFFGLQLLNSVSDV